MEVGTMHERRKFVMERERGKGLVEKIENEGFGFSPILSLMFFLCVFLSHYFLFSHHHFFIFNF
jgi:hypothetical protein